MIKDPDAVLENLKSRYNSKLKKGIFTDGGASPNPGPGGWAVIMVEDNEVVKRIWGREDCTTNNRMELKAILEAYKLADADSEAVIYTDSMLCVKSINLWLEGWISRGWRTASGKRVKNKDFLSSIYEERKKKPLVRVEWIESHAGDLWNEYVHLLVELARCGAGGQSG